MGRIYRHRKRHGVAGGKAGKIVGRRKLIGCSGNYRGEKDIPGSAHLNIKPVRCFLIAQQRSVRRGVLEAHLE